MGCASFSTIGVKHAPSDEGFYTGFRQQAYYTHEDNRLYRNYIDLGYSHMFDEVSRSMYGIDLDYTFVKINASVPLYEDDMTNIGVSGGENLRFSAGYDVYFNDEEKYSEFHVSSGLFFPVSITLYRMHGDTDKKGAIDVFALLGDDVEELAYNPGSADFLWTVGNRVTWNEDSQGSALFTAFVWKICDKNLLIELGYIVDNSPWFARDEYEVKSQAGITARYYF